MDDLLLSQIKEIAIREYPKEACGVIVAIGKKPKVLQCANLHSEPTKYFILSPEDYSNAADQGEVIGIWHTHPNASSRPSEDDIAYCEKNGVDWLIVGLRKSGEEFTFDAPTLLQPTGYVAPYLGRPYVYGAYDCYTLVQDYYKREFDIDLNSYPIEEEWWLRGLDRFTERFKELGFVKMVAEEPKVGDLFMIQCGAAVPNHLAIYLGDDTILHHCRGRLSSRDTYGNGYWRKHTIYHLRHELKC